MINTWSSDDLDMDVLEYSMDDRRMSYDSMIGFLEMILVSHGGMTRTAETESWETSSWLKGRLLTWSNVKFLRMSNAVGMRILWFFPNNWYILTLKILESLTIPVVAVGRVCS